MLFSEWQSLSHAYSTHYAVWQTLKCICGRLHCATWSFNKPKQIIFSPSHIILFMNKVFRFWARVYFHESWIRNSWIDLQVFWGRLISYPESTINCVICQYILGAGEKTKKKRGRGGCKTITEVGLPEYFRMLILWVRVMRTTTTGTSITMTFRHFLIPFLPLILACLNSYFGCCTALLCL